MAPEALCNKIYKISKIKSLQYGCQNESQPNSNKRTKYIKQKTQKKTQIQQLLAKQHLLKSHV